MPRPAASDPLHSFRFHAKVRSGPDLGGTDNGSANQANDLLQPEGNEAGSGYIIGDGSEAGFNSITMPEITVEHAEYREGIRVYTMKFPGVPTIAEITFNRGVARNDTAFFNWVLAAIEGNEYRADIVVYHIQRPANEHVADTSRGNELDAEAAISKEYHLYNCSPARVKVAGDLDASTSDISLAELDVALERFDVVRPVNA
jgi:phage tail-like protein